MSFARYIHFLTLAGLLLTTVAPSTFAADITGLRTEYMETPLGIDLPQPRFSWQMIAPAGEHGYAQQSYRIVVKDDTGAVVWDTERVAGDVSLGITYAGSPLQPTTRYTWELTVWDNNGDTTTESSWFETGLMNPDESAWAGAEWIGGGDEDLVLYSQYLSVFKMNYTAQLDRASNSTRAGFVLGANDQRLMDRNLNIYGLENGRDASYILFEIDISAVDGSEDGRAVFNIYRVGYHPNDAEDRPFEQLPIPTTIINQSNKYEPHRVIAASNFGQFMIYIDAEDDEHRITVSDNPNPGPFSSPSLNLNPVGSGGNFISFPMVADIGFAMAPGQKARFSDVEIRNYRSPSNALFSEDLSSGGAYSGIFAAQTGAGLSVGNGAYQLNGGNTGQMFVADPSRNAMPMLRTEFDVAGKAVESARLYVTARGVYEIHLNGERVGEDYFNPGLTQYNINHMYQTYDVTPMLASGRNAIGAMLGEGWWSGNITFSGNNWNYFGDRQSLLARLVVTYADGSSDEVITSPDTWSYYDDGPVRYGSFFQGEVYDATREAAVDGWSTAGYDDSAWKPAVTVPLDGTAFTGDNLNYDHFALIGQIGRNAGVVMTLTARRVDEVRPGVFVYDMGQNMVGVPEVTIRGGRSGQAVTMRFAEMKYPNLDEHGNNVGMIMQENLRAALVQDIHILKGGDEVIQPRFTFHGYRYLEITGIDEALPLESVKGKVISSIAELASSYETSNPKVNRLWQNITWSMRGNFLSIPTDTPARNERMGWSGDLSVFSRSSTYLANAEPFLRRHMLAMRDVQRADGRFTDVAPMGGGFGGTLWGSAGITVAWEAYQQYRDLDMLAEHYDAMKRYLAFLAGRIDAERNILNEGPLGDWLSPENGQNDNTLLWEAYYLFDLEIMANVAHVLGKSDDAAAYREQFEARKKHFNETYVDPETGQTIASGFATRSFGGGAPLAAGDLIDTQASYAVPLALGVFDEANAPRAARNLVEAIARTNEDDSGVTRPAYSLMTGFIGTAWISKALSDYGHDETAYRLLQQTSYPSWLYPVDQGATTIWERLNSYTVEDGFGGNNSMNSFNHYSFGAVGAWMYNYSLGIQRDEREPGFKHFILQPTPDPTGEMQWARGHYDSMYGRIESAWEIQGDAVSYRFAVPANTSATLNLQAPSESAVTISGRAASDAEGVRFIGYEAGRAVYELSSGSYDIVVR